MASGKEILAKLKLDSKDFQKGISDSQKSLLAISGTITALGASVLALTKLTANYNDEMIKSARAAGESAESFSALSHAATMAGASQEELGKALIKLNSQSPAVTQSLKELGISVNNANGGLKTGSQLLGDVADRMAKTNSAATRTAIAVKVFGDEGTKLVSMLAGGSKGLAAATAEAEKLGLVVSERAGKAAEKFNDDMSLTVKTLGGLSRAVGESVIEFMNQSNALGVVRDVVSSMTRFWRGLSDETKNTIINAALLTTVIGGIILAIGVLTALKPQIMAFFSSIRAGINLATFGVAGLIASIVALGSAFIEYWSQIKSVFEPMVESFREVGRMMAGLKKSFSDAFSFDSSPASNNLDKVQSKFQQTWEKMSLLGTVAKAVAATVGAIIQTILLPIKIVIEGITNLVDTAKLRIEQVKKFAAGQFQEVLALDQKIFEAQKASNNRQKELIDKWAEDMRKKTDVLVVKTPEVKIDEKKDKRQAASVDSIKAQKKELSELEQAFANASRAADNYAISSRNGVVSVNKVIQSSAKVLEDYVNAINAVTQKIVGYAQTAISAFSGFSDAIANGIKQRFETEDRDRQVAILRFTKSIEARIKATEDSENKRLEMLGAQFDREIDMLKAQEDEKLAVAEQAMNERLLLADTEYQAAKEKAERQHAEFMEAERLRYETEKELLLEKAVDKEQRQLVETEMDAGFKEYVLALEQQFQQSQTELAKNYAENRKNNEASHKENLKAIETNSKAQIEALTKQKNDTLKKEEEEKNKKLTALEAEKNSTLAAMEKERTQKKWEAEVAQFRATKAAKTAEIIASGIAAAAAGFAAVAGIPFVGLALGAAIAATILTTTYMRVSQLQSAEPVRPAELSLGEGGVLGGNFSHASGNDIPARLESNELVVDKTRTKQMFDAIDSGMLGAKKEINVYFEKGSIQTYDISDDSVIDKLSFAVVRRVEQAGGFA